MSEVNTNVKVLDTTINFSQIKEGMRVSYLDEKSKLIFGKLDKNNDGILSQDEIDQMIEDLTPFMEDGKITKREMKKYLANQDLQNVTAEDMTEFVQQVSSQSVNRAEKILQKELGSAAGGLIQTVKDDGTVIYEYEPESSHYKERNLRYRFTYKETPNGYEYDVFKYNGYSIEESKKVKYQNGLGATEIRSASGFTTIKREGVGLISQNKGIVHETIDLSRRSDGVSVWCKYDYKGNTTKLYRKAQSNEWSEIVPFERLPKLEIENITSLNNPEYSDKKAVKIGDLYYDFDSQGRVEYVYANKPETNKYGTVNSFTHIVYDDNGEVTVYQYLNRGKINSDGTRQCAVYNGKGETSFYYVESCFDTENSEAGLVKVYDCEDKIYHMTTSREVVQSFLSKESVSNEDADKIAQMVLHDMYDSSFAEELKKELADSKNSLNGKEVMDKIIQIVLNREKSVGDSDYKYTDDIETDMKSHPNDFEKLTVDLLRLMNRGKINTTEDHGDDIVNLNGKIDEKVEQGNTGDCWLVASLIAISKKSKGAALLQSMISWNKDTHIATAKIGGKEYQISEEEIVKSDHLSTGDDDMRVIEIAVDKYIRDLAYEGNSEEVDITGGTLSKTIKILFGTSDNVETKNQNSITDTDIKEFNNDNIINTFDLGDSETSLKALNEKDEQISLLANHEYAIIGSDDAYVYFINPHESSKTLKMKIEDFKNITNLNIERFSL